MNIIKQLSMTVVTLGLAAMTSFGGTICPGGNTTNFAHNPDPAATGCNTLITINANNTVTVTVPDSAPYDGVEDTLVGVVNNSSMTINTLLLSGNDIFGLDGDGVCVFTFAAANGVSGSNYCSNSQVNGTDPQDYYGPTTTFTIINVNSGNVNFTGGLAAGGKTFFSLEEPPTAQLQVVVGGAPEPATCAMLLGGLGSLWLYRRRRS